MEGLCLMGGVKDFRDEVRALQLIILPHFFLFYPPPAQKLQAMQLLGAGTLSLSMCHHLRFLKKHFLYDLKSLGRLYFSFLYNLILSDTEHVQVSLFFFNLIIPTFLITRRFSHTICYLGISVSPPPVIPGNGSGVRSAGSDECEAALSAFL